MANITPENTIFSFLVFLFIVVFVQTKAVQTNARLQTNYYEQSCPEAEQIIANAVLQASMHDSKVPPRLLRMFFHDCFVMGCDASLLLDSTHKNKAEKDGPPNISIGAYNVIDRAKAKLEKACPRTVSCADILAIAARDAVTMTGGPYWEVLKGRKDGRRSTAKDSLNLPKPSFNVTQLIQLFSEKGLNINDLVALSGAHTLGEAHCASFEDRIRHFSDTDDVDPSMDVTFAHMLKGRCPTHNKDHNAGLSMDSTTLAFDNDYYRRLKIGRGILVSDQLLYSDHRTRDLVHLYAENQNMFFRQFAASMVNLGNVDLNHHGEVRRDCRYAN